MDLKKNEENGVATLLVNNPSKKNAFTGKFKHDFNIINFFARHTGKFKYDLIVHNPSYLHGIKVHLSIIIRFICLVYR